MSHVVVSKEEGDRIAAMVLELVEFIVHGQGRRPDRIRGVEPTGITVDPVMRPFVEQRSTDRLPEGGRMPKRKAS